MPTLLIRLIAFADQHHDFKADGCHPTPGEDCWPFCEACKLLADVDADTLRQAREWALAERIRTES